MSDKNFQVTRSSADEPYGTMYNTIESIDFFFKVLRFGYIMVRIDGYENDATGSDWFCYHQVSPMMCLFIPICYNLFLGNCVHMDN